jgi:hypothetical protein
MKDLVPLVQAHSAGLVVNHFFGMECFLTDHHWPSPAISCFSNFLSILIRSEKCTGSVILADDWQERKYRPVMASDGR